MSVPWRWSGYWMTVVGGSRESPSLMQSAFPAPERWRLYLLLPRPMAVRCGQGCKPLPHGDLLLAEGGTISCEHQVQKVDGRAFAQKQCEWGDHPAGRSFHDCPAPGAGDRGMCRCCDGCTEKCRGGRHALRAVPR